jgi:hypothetical protein
MFVYSVVEDILGLPHSRPDGEDVKLCLRLVAASMHYAKVPLILTALSVLGIFKVDHDHDIALYLNLESKTHSNASNEILLSIDDIGGRLISRHFYKLGMNEDDY